MLSSSSLSVTTAASDRSLITLPQLRAALGMTDSSQDIPLLALAARVSAAIVSACSVARSGATPPTLREEILTEVFRHTRDYRVQGPPYVRDNERVEPIVLSRRPIVSVASVTIDGVLLDGTTDYEVDQGAGLLYHLFSDTRISWRCRKAQVAYTAGWEIVPEDIVQAASRLAQIYWSATQQDLNVRVDLIQDVGRTEYFANPLGDGAFPADVLELLAPYMNYTVV